MFCLNVVGSTILALIDAGYDESQITQQVSAAYDADIDTVRVDVHDFLETLNRHGVLRRDDSGAPVQPEATHGRADAS
jgi:hypothetical protein